MPSVFNEMVDAIRISCSGPGMNPVVLGVRDVVSQVVPGAVLEKVKLDGSCPDKFIRINIANACKALSNKLRKILETGDCGGYVLLRSQMQQFMQVCAEPIASLPENDTRPLTILSDAIEKCDKESLIRNGTHGLKVLIETTDYLSKNGTHRFDKRDNTRWVGLETVLTGVFQLAKEFDMPLGEIQELMDDKEIYGPSVSQRLQEMKRDIAFCSRNKKSQVWSTWYSNLSLRLSGGIPAHTPHKRPIPGGAFGKDRNRDRRR